ncbi:uncharacterized protein PV09_02893 [Verruconis gallopava]|uniref:Uncharacterized protein n=1 Tax=Verruconis gallopava TaxID=253628 RepID=A0A0D2B5F9_9PEZI|nr:uncharacterized protein PV09_02893 [Verruconis gallopava]KIW06449.1 hypothetical protein PV09_02893 [Verruconis gallopava]
MASPGRDQVSEHHRSTCPRLREVPSYKQDPAAFAQSLVEHSGFEAVARSFSPPPSYSSPPPSYSRLAQLPRLTIPADNSSQDRSAARTEAPATPGSYSTDGVTNSPSDAVQSRSQDSPLSKIRLKIRKHSTGFRDRLRRPGFNSRNSSSTISPCDLSPYVFSDIATTPDSPMSAAELDAIPELDSHTIQPRDPCLNENLESHHLLSDSDHGLQREVLTTEPASIIPTPPSVLPTTSPSSNQKPSSSVNAADLSGRLQSLHRDYGQQRHDLDSTLSPCSLVSSQNSGHFVWKTNLSRSNAIKDGIPRSQCPEPPSREEVPNVLPESRRLDGRLEGLPRLVVPNNGTLPNIPAMGDVQSRIEQGDYGKELVASTDSAAGVSEQLCRSLRWNSSRSMSSRAQVPISQAIDAADAPEVVDNEGSMYPLSTLKAAAWQRSYSANKSYQISSPQTSFVGSLCDVMVYAVTKGTDFLKTRYGPEPPVEESHVRVRWRCSCGEDLYDDYIENRPGAAAELEAYLNKATDHAGFRIVNSQPSSAADSVFSPGTGLSPQSSASSWSSPSVSSPACPSPYEQRWTEMSRGNALNSTHKSYHSNLSTYVNPLWLYACMNEGKWCTKMRHLDVNFARIGSDKDLALALSNLYTQVNKKWTKILKLRGLTSIRFVQFELHRNRIADISRSPALPDPFSAEGFSYEFEPHDLNPPVGSNYLMHLFKHPEDYDNELITYSRTPKRRDRLELGTGWGLELVEDFLAERVWGALLAMLMLGSIIFTITWAYKKGDDIRGAFGVACYTVTAASLLLAWAQAAFD